MTAPAGGVTVGVVTLIGDFFCLPNDSVAAGAAVECDLVGEWNLPKALVAFTEGEAVYWDETNDQCAKAGRFIGHASRFGGEAAASTTMRVRIDSRAHKPGASAGTARLELDATAGLAIATYYGDSIPDNARVTRSWYEVGTTFTSATDAATLSLGVETDDVAGITAAIAISDGSNPWDAGLADGIQDGAIANFGEKTTAEGRRLEVVVAVEALTAGVLALVAEWAVTV
jgi:predicted RecA/RadA family phage recombinase